MRYRTISYVSAHIMVLYTGFSDGLLQGWSCKLLHHQADDTRAPGERESDKNKRSIPPRTIFVSSSGQVCASSTVWICLL